MRDLNQILDEGRLAAKRITYSSMRKTSLVTLILIGCYCVPSLVRAQETVMATINGQDEYRISGSIECGSGEVTSTIKPGERFIARELSHGEGYWEVYLKSGISGNIPRNRIRLLPNEPLARLNFESCKKEWRKLQSKPIKKTDYAAYHAKKYYGVANYYKTLVQASEGDAKAFAQFDSLAHMDGEAGEGHEETTWVLLHVAGDDTFAKLLSPEFREGYAEVFASWGTVFFSNPKAYIKLHFPKTYALLYGNAAQQTKADQKPIEEVKAKAEAGDADSQVELGLRYLDGEDVPKNQVEAVKWFGKAAEQNFAKAQFNLNVCYYNGEGVAKDYVEAYKWLLLADRQGDEDAKKNITVVESELTPEQIAEGQKRARDFKPR
jgi:hypothetical protein